MPYDKNDLRLGGVSFFFGQRAFMEIMREGCNYSSRSMERDLRVLGLIDQLPSLDPFLLHEQLISNGILVADCYFELSKADKTRMHEFVAHEIRDLIGLATRDATSGPAKDDVSSTQCLVSALLTAGAEEQLESLRLALMIEESQFRLGIFCWRGFLYYKWCANDLLPKISAVSREINRIRVARVSRGEEMNYIVSVKRQLMVRINQIVSDVNKTLAIYDSYYSDLVTNGQAKSFREFLLRAPHMFTELGEKMGALGHITSFWKYRFPKRDRARRRGTSRLDLPRFHGQRWRARRRRPGRAAARSLRRPQIKAVRTRACSRWESRQAESPSRSCGCFRRMPPRRIRPASRDTPAFPSTAW